MPRRSILSAAERASLLTLPEAQDELIQHYTLSEADLSLIRQRRGDANRLGVAVQLCLLRYPGQGLLPGAAVPVSFLHWVGRQLRTDAACWPQYAEREETRREHLLELRAYLRVEPFGLAHYRQAVHATTELAMQTDKGIVLAASVLDALRHQHIIIPALDVIERVCAEAITRANQRIHEALSEPLSDTHRRRLDDLLKRRDNGKATWLAWLRQSPVKPNSRHMLEHIERLKAWQALDLPAGIERLVHQNRLLKIAREGGQMTPADLAKFEPQRRYATLVALAVEGTATVTDEIIDLHDRILGKLFNAAKNKHLQQFQASGKAINAKVRLYGRIGQALIEAKQAGRDPFAAIEAVISWDAFAESVTEAQKLAQPDDFDFLHRIGESYATLRRYAPEFLEVLKLRAAPAAKNVLEWLRTEPSQAERDHFGQLLFDTFMRCTFALHRLQADPHPGNYLFMADGQLGLLDFGCTRQLKPHFCEGLASAWSALLCTPCDAGRLRQAYQQLGMVSPRLSEHDFTAQLMPALADMQQWQTQPFAADVFDFGQHPPPRLSPQHRRQALPLMHAMPPDLPYFDRAYLGLVQMLRTLGARVRTTNPWIHLENGK